MKKLFIFCLSAINLINAAALIPDKVRTQSSYFAKKATEKVLGPTLTNKLKNHATTFLDWSNFYLKQVSPKTQNEFKMHGLWYGLKSGNMRSLYGEDPFHTIHNYYLKNKNNWDSHNKRNKSDTINQDEDIFNKPLIDLSEKKDSKKKGEALHKNLKPDTKNLWPIRTTKEKNKNIFLHKKDFHKIPEKKQIFKRTEFKYFHD